MTDLAYFLSFAFNAAIASSAYLVLRRRVKSARFKAARAKSIYASIVVAGGALSGLVLFHGMIDFFRRLGMSASYGHGEVNVAAAVFNVFLSLVLMVVGRILLSWKPVRW